MRHLLYLKCFPGMAFVRRNPAPSAPKSAHLRGNMKSRTLILITVMTLSNALVAPFLDAQSVVQRRRLGNNTEAITTIHAGPLNGYVAIMDGTDVLAFANGGLGDVPVQKLFSVLGLGVNIGPRGIAYINAEQLFVFNDPTQPNTLFLSDNEGEPEGTINVTFTAGFVPDYIEGLVWLPPTVAKFGNHILAVGVNFTTGVRIEVIDRNSGQVVAEILPNLGNRSDSIVGLGFQSPDRLLVGATDGTIWKIDFSGNITAGPVSFPGVGDIEGVAQVDSNHIAAAGYDAGKVMFLDGNLNPLVGQERSYLIGFGLSQSNGVAWDPDLLRHLVNLPGSVPPSSVEQIVSLPFTLGSARQVVNTSGVAGSRALSYLPDEHRIALSQNGCAPNCVIFLYDNTGNLVEQVPVGFGLRAMTYIPTRKQFAGAGPADPTTLLTIARDGTLVNSIDLASIGIDAIFGAAFFNPLHPSGGEFLLLSSPATHKAFVIDFTGQLLREFDYKTALQTVTAADVSAITSGPLGGAFSLVSADTSEIVVFLLSSLESSNGLGTN